MVKDIFGREIDLGDPISVDAARLTIPGIGMDMLVQQLQVQYQQDITRLYDLSSPKVYFVRGRSQGQGSIGKVVGSKGPVKEFILQYGNVCNIRNNNLSFTFSGGCVPGGKQSRIAMSGVVINSVAYQVSTPDMIVNEQISLMFVAIPQDGIS